MADFFFFTEPSKLNDQIAAQAFGAVDENQFRIGNMFSATADAKAFAITDGLVLVQQIGTTNKYNIVLKPSQQPDLSLPKIDYIIYKGIKKSSIITGSKVAAASKNDLTSVIHAGAQQWYAADGLSVPSTEPAANTSLGLGYSATNSDPDFVIEDSATLDSVFYSSNAITLPFAFGGNYIGDFDSSGEIGIVVVFEKIGYKPTFKIARELQSTMTFDPLPSSPSNAEIFKRKNEKERVLSYADSTAFFGAFNGLGIKVFDGSAFVSKNGDELYNEVVSKHFNKNIIYLDIRNDSDDFFNYYENYGDTIEWSLDNSENMVSVDYLRNDKWPILTIDDTSGSSEFSAGNINKVIKVAVQRGDNEIPLLYYKRAFKNDLGFELPKGKDRFLTPTIEDDKVSFEHIVPYVTAGRANANYFQLRNIRRVKNNEDPADNFPTQGFSIPKNGHLDGLFPIFDMTVPFDESTDRCYSKIYYDVSFIDKENVNGAQYTANLGIGKDTLITTFIATPSKYNLNIQQNVDDKIPLSGFEGPESTLFLFELNNQIQSVKLVRSQFKIAGTTHEYLRFDKQTIGTHDQIENYKFEDVSILAMTNQQFQELEQLKVQEFPIGYKIHLGVENIVVGIDDNGISYTKFEYVLRGIKEDGNGEIIRHSASPSPAMIVYTDEEILDYEYVRNYEESIGYDNFQDVGNGIRYEDFFIDKQPEISQIAKKFKAQLDNIDTSSETLFEQIRSLVSATGKSLWGAGVNFVQDNPNNPDDRPLYWARLQMTVTIKQHVLFKEDFEANLQVKKGSKLSQVIDLFEETSRNYSGVSFTNAPVGTKKILITGFDPFFLNPAPPFNDNIRQSNPSGVAALSLHKTITDNGLGYIESMVVPVRYPDFDGSQKSNEGQGDGIVEKYIGSFIGVADMIITMSQDGNFGDYNIDQYATKTRGGSIIDNLNFVRTALSDSVAQGDEWIITKLPTEFIQDPVKEDFTYIDNLADYNSSTLKDGSVVPPMQNQKMYRGPGGNYLSNEIFYRVAKLRKASSNPDFPTGHFHVSNLQASGGDFNPSDAEQLVEIIKEAVDNGVTGI